MAGDRAEGLADDLVTALVEVDFLEVHGVLESVGAERLPPGWRKFSPASKRRTLKKIVDSLSEKQLADLASDFLEGAREIEAAESDEEPPSPSANRYSPARRPIYAVPDGIQSLEEKYGLKESRAHVTAANSNEPTAEVAQTDAPQLDADATVFIVHGRDTSVESQVQLLFVRTTGRDPVVLHEQVTGGRTVIEQIERHGGSAVFAIVLLTGDDEGGLRGGDMKPRARQNVVLELGYFWGKLGRDHVAVLVQDGVELPSDAAGIHYIGLDSGGWKAKLLQELESVGFMVDWSQLRM